MRILIAEDEEHIAKTIVPLYRELFTQRGAAPTIEHTTSALEAIRRAEQAGRRAPWCPYTSAAEAKMKREQEPYDFVSLDVSLDEPGVTGLSVLDAFAQNKAAWMVAVFTGIETDNRADAKHTKEVAEKLRNELRSQVCARFPSDRVMIVEKPSKHEIEIKQQELFRNRLNQVVHNYYRITQSRYMFKRIEAEKTARRMTTENSRGKRETVLIKDTAHRICYQIRCGCEDMAELNEDDWNGLRTMHELFKRGRSGTISADDSLILEPYTPRSAKNSSAEESGPHTDPKEIITTIFSDWRDLSATEIATKLNDIRDLRKIEHSQRLTEQQEIALEKLEKLEEQVDFGNPVETTLAGANQDGLEGVRVRKPRSKTEQRFSAMKSKLCKRLRAHGRIAFAEYIQYCVKGYDTKWTHVQPPHIDWTTR